MTLKIGLVTLAVALAMLAEVVGAQYTNPALPSPTAPPAKSDKAPVEHGSRPDPGAVRPGNQDGDQPSASAGDLIRDAKERRIFGLPVNAALVVAGVIVALFVVAGVAIPAARRRDRARGNGAYR